MADKPDWMHGGFGLYLHWPFCQAKCPYCDFNSHVASQIDQDIWRDAYLREIRRAGKETEGRILDSVFFGGGTPSMMDASLVDAILREIKATWPVANDIEVTLEANPTSVEAARFAGYREAGVNRVSMGVQALNDADLKALGRLHTVDEAMAAFDIAKATFDRVSFDLIYARQNQTEADWEAELQTALDLAVDHLSLYQLTIEENTAFGDRFARGRLPGLPDEERGLALWDITQSLCQAAGFAQYEVSNHAKPGQESRHNLIYWQAGDYIGIGPGAHGRLTLGSERWATECHMAPTQWLAAVTSGSGESVRERLSAQDQLEEKVLMGLRTTEGIGKHRFTASEFDRLSNKINNLIDERLLEVTDTDIRVSPNGRPLLNAVIATLLR